MKRILFLIIGLFFTLISYSQLIVSTGKNNPNVCLDILGREDTITRWANFTVEILGDTLIEQMIKMGPEDTKYHSSYYYVNNICVKQKTIILSGNSVEAILIFYINDNNPNILFSHYNFKIPYIIREDLYARPNNEGGVKYNTEFDLNQNLDKQK